MWQKLVRDSSFFLALLALDRDLAEQYRKDGCAACGAKVHRAAYERKPRGGPRDLPKDYVVRESFCCSAEGCRQRLTPPSVRFLGRRVYLAVVFVLVSAMVHGVTEKRANEMRELVGVSRRTLERWRQWWRGLFVRTSFWKASGARFSPPVERSKLPASLLERFTQARESERAVAVLRFLAPLGAGANWPVVY